MSKLPRLSEESYESSTSSSRAPNFSRPGRPQGYQPQPILKKDHNQPPDVRTISAFHEPTRDLPEEPRFSIDSDQTATTSSDNSAGSDFAWDGETGELRTKSRPKKYDDQRATKDPRTRPTTSKTATSGSTMGVPSSSSSKSMSIMKRVSVDQQSERMSYSTDRDQVEDTASHHTVSEDGDSSIEIGDEWRSSDYDTSGLTDKQIRKLIRKGVNPALYAEMEAAKKKGKNKLIGPLLGNSFLG